MKFFKQLSTTLILICLAASSLLLCSCSNDIYSKASSSITLYADKGLLSFSVTMDDNPSILDEPETRIEDTSITLVTERESDFSALVARFTTTGQSVMVNGETQTSGVTPNDFTMPVVYTVTAEDGSTVDYTVAIEPKYLEGVDDPVITSFITGNGFVDIGWDEAETNGYYAVQIYNKDTGVVLLTIKEGIESASITGLTNGTVYNLVMRLVDGWGNVTQGVSLSAIPTETTVEYSLIKTAEDLYNVRNNTAGSYLIVNDLDLSSYSSWTPIPSYSGCLNGGGYTVTGLSIDSAGVTGQGLFAELGSGGYIANLNLDTVKIGDATGSTAGCGSCSAAIVGNQLAGSTIHSCSVSGEIVGDGTYLGGLAGYTNGTIESCSVDVTLVLLAGGYAGTLAGYADSSSTLYNSYNTTDSKVTCSAGDYVGGLVGTLSGGAISSCRNYADVTAASSSGVGGITGNATGSLSGVKSSASITGDSLVGGIAGYMENGSVSSSSASGTVTGNSSYVGGAFGQIGATTSVNATTVGTTTVTGAGSVGGFAGQAADDDIYLDSCSATATVSSTGDNAGGFVGYFGGGTGTTEITNSSVTASVSSTGDYAGGFVGCFASGGSFAIADCSATVGEVIVEDCHCGGGFVGQISDGVISGCRVTVAGTVCASYNSGGFAGYVIGSVNDPLISGCHASGGTVLASNNNINVGLRAGGFAGFVNGASAQILECSSAFDRVESIEDSAGGFVGVLEYATVDQCFARYNGAVVVSGDYAGGFAGKMSSSPTLSNSYAICQSDTDTAVQVGGSYGGGLVGYFDSGSIEYCYAVSAVSSSTPACDPFIGGSSLGSLTGESISCSSATTSYSSVYLSELTETELKGGATSPLNDAGIWLNSSEWAIDSLINNGYPYLVNNAP